MTTSDQFLPTNSNTKYQGVTSAVLAAFHLLAETY